MLKRPSNHPREAIQRLAAVAVAEHGGPDYARVFYKFDCAACGSREMCPDPNVLPETATCHLCGHVTTIRAGGYALQLRRSITTPFTAPQDSPVVVRRRYESDRGDA